MPGIVYIKMLVWIPINNERSAQEYSFFYCQELGCIAALCQRNFRKQDVNNNLLPAKEINDRGGVFPVIKVHINKKLCTALVHSACFCTIMNNSKCIA